MVRDGDTASWFWTRIGALEADVERLEKDKARVESENRALRARLFLNGISHEMTDIDGEFDEQ